MSYADFEGAPMPEPEEDEEEDAEAAAARRAQAAQSGPESAASREARARRCPVTRTHLPHMLQSTNYAESASV